MYMDRTCYTIMYNDNNVKYHEPRHDLYYTVNTTIIELNSILNGTRETKYFGDLCCKIFINVSICNINTSNLTSIHIHKYLVVHECL